MSTLSAPLRVLVVDDEPAILRFLRPSLATQGYVVSEAKDGRSALEAIRAKAADVVVLDLGLPDMDGLEIIRKLRGGGSKPCRSSFLSSREAEGLKVEALDLGADDYVTKPFGIDELAGAHPRRATPSASAAGRKSDFPQRRSDRRSCPPDRHRPRPGGEILAARI